jgi:hypothetical protein
MPTNLKIAPRLLSFAATFVLLAVVNADAQQQATRSVVIPPIPPGRPEFGSIVARSPPLNLSTVEQRR